MLYITRPREICGLVPPGATRLSTSPLQPHRTSLLAFLPYQVACIPVNGMVALFHHESWYKSRFWLRFSFSHTWIPSNTTTVMVDNVSGLDIQGERSAALVRASVGARAIFVNPVTPKSLKRKEFLSTLTMVPFYGKWWKVWKLDMWSLLRSRLID